ncbi:uncharacterized protein BT62DRAFT_1012559 [Guyanagaster necrorhizus]|uniref:Uncharacterized protein n=1 Tax=Guyanagaster necrorhizus TaxID=856835 RepID=A0A9P7VHT2_9AGAR|nr:uncharacterized protein BT62DRAFT_1012559 [Guyanagaster necrorhizus MCA 3950]KAG7440625.1 hypothetical protein BT62DRAFT_1012559 [Guyanagaster necrorhizus MCA 3950]
MEYSESRKAMFCAASTSLDHLNWALLLFIRIVTEMTGGIGDIGPDELDWLVRAPEGKGSQPLCMFRYEGTHIASLFTTGDSFPLPYLAHGFLIFVPCIGLASITRVPRETRIGTYSDLLLVRSIYADRHQNEALRSLRSSQVLVAND